MSDRLYYQDPDCLRFTARLLRQWREGERWAVTLDATAFYPEGGGHPPDRGTLDGIPVVDVQEVDGEVLHFLGEPLGVPAAGATGTRGTSGEVHAGHRWEYRQQHTGQHVVSASLAETAGALTLSAHLGERYVSVEIDREALGEEELLESESLANRIVTENLPVRVQWVGRDRLAGFRLRKPPPAGIERLRIVEIPGHDASACGGLHVNTTGAVGLIQLIGLERIRGRLRLSWRIGERAYREIRETERMTQELGRELGCRREEIPAVIRELKERLRSREVEAQQLKRRFAALQAAALRERGRPLGALTLVLHRMEEQDPELAEETFRALVSAPGVAACLVWQEADALRWIAGSSGELTLDIGALVLPHLGLIDGRGGGRGHRFQGVGSEPGGAEAFLSAVGAALEKRADPSG